MMRIRIRRPPACPPLGREPVGGRSTTEPRQRGRSLHLATPHNPAAQPPALGDPYPAVSPLLPEHPVPQGLSLGEGFRGARRKLVGTKIKGRGLRQRDGQTEVECGSLTLTPGAGAGFGGPLRGEERRCSLYYPLVIGPESLTIEGGQGHGDLSSRWSGPRGPEDGEGQGLNAGIPGPQGI